MNADRFRDPPLAAVRVIEAGQLLAVPHAARLLADLGAEVIKIESPLRLDTHRQTTYPRNDPGDAFWDRGGTFYSENRGKLGMTLDLRQSQAVEVFRALVRISDVVMENFTPRVMQAFGLDYAALAAVRPDLIMLSSTGYGHSGPWSNYAAVGPTTEAASGLAAVSGYRDGGPVLPDIPYTDYVAAEQAVFAILLALYRRRRSGRGGYIDLAQTEAQTAVAGELILDAVLNRAAAVPRGNRHPAMSPHGFFPCAGVDRWIAIAVETDVQWQSLLRTLGDADPALTPRLETLVGRKQHEDELETMLSRWTSFQDAMQLMHLLQARGIPAGAVLDGRDLVRNDHLRARGFFQWLAHPAHSGIGSKPYAGVPWRFSQSRRGTARAAPALGEQTEAVLQETLGYSRKQIMHLRSSGALGGPVEGFRRPRPVPLDELLNQGSLLEVDPNFEREIAPD